MQLKSLRYNTRSTYKRRCVALLLLTLSTSVVLAQRSLTNSRQSSYYTYIYKLNADEVIQFYKSPNAAPSQSVLHTVVDSFRTDGKWIDKLPPGNYLKVYALKNKLQYQLIENHSAELHVLRNNYDLNFQLTDKQGKIIPDADVTVDKKGAAFDAVTATYHLKYIKKNMLVRADYGGISNFYSLSAYLHFDRNFLSRNWFKFQWNKVKRIWAKEKDNPYKYRSQLRDNENSKFTGFMAFNKPRYKPGDTIRFKAFVLTKKSREPVSVKQLIVRLKEDYDDNGKIIGKVDSYRNGAFNYQFILNDSLKLSLDNEYTISLEDPSSLKYDLDKYDGDDEDKFLTQRKVFITGKFKYEDYELKSIHFTTRTDKTEHEPGNPLAVYLKATDENDLPVSEGRVKLTITTQNINHYKAPQLFIPDTLWKHDVILEQLGETKVLIPDSIFPKADINYTIQAAFLNSNNESQYQSNDMRYNYSRFKIAAQLTGDTIKADYFVSGKKTSTVGTMSTISNTGDTIASQTIKLPFTGKINAYAVNYLIKTDSASSYTNLKSFESGLNFSGYRTIDSVFVKVNNPRKIPFEYWVFDGGRLVDKGKADTLTYKRASAKDAKIGFLLSYIWGGEAKFTGNTVPYQDKLLTINVKQPVSVYPGQQVKTEIVVTDVTGKPVPNTDLTAWSFTKKFQDYNPPFVPYLGKNYYFKSTPQVNFYPLRFSGAMDLNWIKLSRSMGLDSIAYYQFIHPKSVYRLEEPAPDSLTQIAPFLVKDGDILPVHILYIDERPVFFNQAEQLQRYSFIVRPGLHTIRFRMLNKTIVLHDVEVAKNRKLILSFNTADSLNKSVSVTNIPDTLTKYEADLLNNYMIKVVNNFGWRMASIAQDERLFLLNPYPNNYYNYRQNELLTGPFASNIASFNLRNDQSRDFLIEPGYSYLFEPGLLKQKSINTRYPFSKFLRNSNKPYEDYTQYPLTQLETDTLWQQYLDLRSQTTPLFHNDPITDKVTGRLDIRIKTDIKGKIPFIKNVIVYKNDDPNYIRIYPGNETDLGNLAAGDYRLLFLLKYDRYALMSNIRIKPYGINYYNADLKPLLKDSVSININKIIENRSGIYQSGDSEMRNDVLKLEETFNGQYFDTANLSGMVSGKVVADNDKLPIPGALVFIKGTKIGTQTDINGRFKLRVPKSCTLTFAFIGYERQEIRVEQDEMVNVILKESSNQLNEVVVTGYTTQGKKDLTGAVASVTVTENGPNSIYSISLRGNRMATNNAPLIIVDGVQVADMSGVDPESIKEINTLKDAAATAIYGASGSNGVIIISTKKKVDKYPATDGNVPASEQSLRKNFNDYAYWQPKLITDEQGKASFTTVFPDDITNWRTFVIAINGQRQSGFAEGQLKSFKPVSANFISPQFAVRGDQMNVIGKVLNYNTDPVSVSRTFSYNGKVIKQEALSVKNSKIDTLSVTAAGTDSLTFEYAIKRDNGYFDGERRKIPVIEPGTKETKGIFAVLNTDTTLALKFDQAHGPVTFRAEASLLPVLALEAGRLRTYQYLCNEQLASKLKGLLAEKRICAYLHESFKYEKNLKEVITKLQENRRSQGTWGWWKDTDEELWISLHAVEALLDATSQGYPTYIDKEKLAAYLVYQLESYRGAEKIACLQLLKKLNAKVDFQKYTEVISKELKQQKDPSKYDQFRLMLLKQEAGLNVKIDSLLATEKHTLFSNVYWGDDSYRFFDNSIQLSVLAYRILKNEGKHPDMLTKIRGYLLEQRHNDNWRNTYETSLILETILPDLLKDEKVVKPPVLKLTGAVNETVTKFPYTSTFSNWQLDINKTGSLPVYITGYQQIWNSKPEKVSKEFTVHTNFEKDGNVLTKLKGGEPIILKVQVITKGDADFVMIEMSIPAGCSYESKEQSYYGNEVHREYFKDKVSIFCRKLKPGNYTYTIKLMPRYDGVYTLNPAKAEMMYFPVFYGREGMKKVVIGE